MGPEAWFVAPAGSAVIAAVAAWLSGLPLRRAAGDPTLAERFHRHRMRTALTVSICAIGALLFVQQFAAPATGPWMIPGALAFLFVAAFGSAVGGYPLRRDLSGEGNALPAYLIRITRVFMAMYGFWIGVVLLPFLAHAGGAAAGLVSCGLLLLWSRHHPAFVCATLGATPLDDPVFERIAERSDATPRTFAFGSDRGSYVNAFALPSLRDPRVLLSRPLLRDLSPAEAAGVFAHEVAHHEDFKAETLHAWGWQERAFIIVGTLSPLVLAPGWVPVVLWIWPFLLLVALGSRARGMQDRERYSDRRAVELCGDREAYIRALEKIHVANHLPRRLAGDAEQRSSHPSLARRIAALRDGPENRRSPDGIYESRTNPDASLHIEQGTLGWMDGECLTVPVAELVELRLAPGRGGPRLRAVERSGKKHSFDVRADDVARLQDALDQLDGRLAELPKRSPWDGVGYLVALAVALACLLASARGAFSFMSAILIATAALSMMRRRTRAGFAAVGAMAVFVAAQRLLPGFDRSGWGEFVWACIATTALGGAALLAIVRRTPPQPSRAPRIWIGVGLLAWSTMLLTLAGGDVAFRLHVLGRTAPALFLPWVAAGAACMAVRRRLGAVLLALGLSGMVLGSAWFGRTVAADPFAAEAPACAVEECAYSPLFSVRLPAEASDPSLSPRATRYMVRVGDRFRVGEFDGAHSEFEAHDVAFVDEQQVLKLMGSTAGFRLELVRWDAPDAVVWSLPLEQWALTGELELSVNGDRWEIFAGRHRFVSARLSGRVGSGDARYGSWITEDGCVGDRFAVIDGALLESGCVLGERGMLDSVYDISVVRRIEGEAAGTELRTAAILGALPSMEPDGEILMVSRNHGGGALWTYDARARRLTPHAEVGPCRAWQWDGRRVALLQPQWVALVDIEARSMRRARLPDDPGWGTTLAFANGTILIGWRTAEGLRLDLVDLR